MEKDSYLLSTVNNALTVLDTLSHYKSLSLAEIHRQTGLDKASLFRILYTLEKNGYVEKIDGPQYRLGYKFFYYGNLVAMRQDIVSIARPLLQGFAFNHKLTIHMGTLNNGRVVTICKEESPYDIQVTARIGSNAPAYATAQGRAILAYIPEVRREALLEGYTYKKYSANSVTNAQQCRLLLDEVRQNGYASDIDDRFPGFGSIACPVFDYTGEPACAIGVVAIAQKIREQKKSFLPELRKTAEMISGKLGYESNTYDFLTVGGANE
ncbi:MAG: IclR family transcriptional regulator [Clostridiales bacterium]|nr:IclR family transcriptional regulator [Clostridiales bacterium]